MWKFRSNIIWKICEKLIGDNSMLFLRVYVSLFAPFFIITLICSIVTGTDFTKVLINIFFLAVICLSVSTLVVGLLSTISSSFINCLYGVHANEDHCEVIRNSELDKLIPLKEKGDHESLLCVLTIIEEEHGISARLVYERALCMIELGELRKARRCIKMFLSGEQKKEKDEAYYNYCIQLLDNEQSPLAFDKIMKNSSR